MFGILEIAPVTLGEKLQYGGKMLLIGMGTIFVVLAMLWGCLELMHYLIASSKQEDTQKSENNAASPVPTSVIPAPSQVASDDDEIVAAICAAISAAQAENPQLQFRAVAFKRIH